MPETRPYTAAERLEVARLSRAGKLGQYVDADRVQALFKINPTEYGEINKRVCAEVVEEYKRSLRGG